MNKMDYSIKYCYTNHHAKMMMKYSPSNSFFLLYQSKANLMDLIRILITFVDRKRNQGQLLLPSKKEHVYTIRRIWHSISNLKVIKCGQILDGVFNVAPSCQFVLSWQTLISSKNYTKLYLKGIQDTNSIAYFLVD